MDDILFRSKIVFRLGILTSKSRKGAIMLCREPCLHAFEDDEEEWDIGTWTPIIFDKAFLSGIVQFPTDVMMKQSRKLENKDIIRLEGLWKKNSKGQLKDLDNNNGKESEENKGKEKKFIDIYFKKLGFEQKCPRKEAEESCSFCTDKPTIF